MNIKIDIDDKYEKTSITIQTNQWTEELEELVTIIKGKNRRRIFGVEEDQTILLDPREIDYVFAEKRKVYACMGKKRVEIRMKLYEVEETFAPYGFMRFSKSVIGNLERIERFELSFNGNLCVYFQSGSKEYITRKYVASIKKRLEGGNGHDSGSAE